MSKQSLTSVIVFPARQGSAAIRLQNYCLELDGTLIELIPADDSSFEPDFPCNEFNCRCAWSLHLAARRFYGKPFVWLESDSIPLVPGWLEKLWVEYLKVGKEYLLSSDSNPPDDFVGGIGVYGGNTKHDIPFQFKKASWDMWMVRVMDAHKLGKTPLIQHSYGIYTAGIAAEHRFPRDLGLLRENAVIFHRDKHQDLIGLWTAGKV